MKSKIVYVPVVTESQLEKISALTTALDSIREKLDDLFIDIAASLDVLRGHNHPEGWAEIKIVRDDAVKRVLVIEHKGRPSNGTR
jgi:hypothetical protein